MSTYRYLRGPLTISAVLLALIAVAGCGKKDGGRPRPKASPAQAVKADFKALDIRAVNQSGKPEAGQKANEESAKVISLLNEFYGTAFIDKNAWEGGKHSKLTGLFTAEAQPALGANLGGLALGDLTPKIKSVRPRKQDATKITFLIEDDLTVPAGVVTVLFEATGKTVESSDGPVAILHNASFYLVPEGGGYKIYAYNAELKADTQTKTAAFGAPLQSAERAA
ncbi:MAG: hypothetical protein ACRDIU_01405 [Actinomycetota bacterium]